MCTGTAGCVYVGCVYAGCVYAGCVYAGCVYAGCVYAGVGEKCAGVFVLKTNSILKAQQAAAL